MFERINPWYGALAIAVALTAIAVILALVLKAHWLWIVGLVFAFGAILIGRLIGGGLGPGDPRNE